jgi:hypothetical protein
MRGNYIRQAGQGDMPYGILNVHFSTDERCECKPDQGAAIR